MSEGTEVRGIQGIAGIERTLGLRLPRELPRLGGEDIRELARVVARLVHGLQPERVYLFGSQARGEAGPDSDFDLLVVVPKSDLPGHRLDQQAYRVVGLHSISLDILVMTRDEFDRRAKALASLPAAVVREGRLLYAA